MAEKGSVREMQNTQHKKYKGGSMGSNGDEKDTVADVEKFTRRSPRLMNQSEMKSCYPKVSSQEVSLRNLESSAKGCFRAKSSAERSPRDIELEHLSDSKEKCHSKKIILIDKLNEKPIRRSPRFSASVAAANSNSNSSIELFNSKGKCPSKKVSLGTSDSRYFDGKCFRQFPRRASSIFDGERRETEYAIIQLPETETRETECEFIELPETYVNQPPKNVKTFCTSKNRKKKCETSSFIGDPIPDAEAQEIWGWRYQLKVRNEDAEDFLKLLKEWDNLCRQYEVDNVKRKYSSRSETSRVPKHDDEIATGEYEVSRIIYICYGDPNKTGKRGINFKVRWKGYSSNDDTWEPIGGLSNCKESIQDFVRNGRKLKILPLPGDADVICGGPPCQGISGYNRYRNIDCPLDDEKSRQIVVFMDIVNLLKPKYVLMENVADILRFDKASLGRYALSRLVQMTYQARLGIIAAGCYGLPQFRLRVFLWGAHPCENLPQFPHPTHDVIIRYYPPPEFERNIVAYDEDQPRELEKALVLQDAISDLPAVPHNESREEMSFKNPPETDFQRYIRSTQYEMVGSALEDTKKTENLLYDHRSYPLPEDDYLRVCQIPKRKGANFRDLPGVVVGIDNVARRDSPKKHSVLPSGKPLVPDYAINYEQGKSKRPFGRLWWDETVPTVLTFPSCHNQIVLHPEQDRILTLRECARLQGFPDYYRFCGTVKERYCQVGNAVAIPVARALGYALGLAFHKSSGVEPLLTLPPKFSHSNYFQFKQILPLETE